MSILGDGQANNRPPAAPSEKNVPIRVGLFVIFVLTVVLHTAWGIYFWTAAPTRAPKTSLRYEGEQYLASYPGWNTSNERDAASYNRAVVEVRRTGVPRTQEGGLFSKGALYAYFLTACYWLGGTRLLSVVIPQAILVALSGVLIALTARRIARQSSEVAAIIAACLVLIYIRFATWAGYIDPACLVLFIYASATYLVSGTLTPGRTALLAVLMIAGIYTHGAFFLAASVTMLWLLICFRMDRRPAQLIGACAIVVGVIVSIVLNIGHQDSMQEDQRALMWQANNPWYESMHLSGHWDNRYWYNRMVASDYSSDFTPEQGRRYLQYLERTGGDRSKASLLWARENPGQYAKLCWLRLTAVLGPGLDYNARLGMVASTVWWLLVFPAGFYGLWRYRADRITWLALLTIGAEVSFATFILASARYCVPMYLWLAVYAGVTYATLGSRFFTAAVAARRVS